MGKNDDLSEFLKVDIKLANAIHREDLASYADTLHAGDKVHIVERGENPKTKFGSMDLFQEWTVVKKFPYTVQITRKGIRGITYNRCIPYQSLMLDEQQYIDAASGKLAALLEDDLDIDDEADEAI